MNAAGAEGAWIAAVLEGLGATARGPDVLVGIGDDAAVLHMPAGQHLVATVDMLVEGQHFTLGERGLSPEDVGWKALAVNLSDIAAMGAQPRWALCSLGLPPGLDADFGRRLALGMAELAARWGVRIVGGNVARVPERLVVDVTLLGSVERPLVRSGARAGDLLLVTGRLGAAAAGLAILRQAGRQGSPELLAAQCRPVPRVAEGCALSGAAQWIHAACDISDGLVWDLARLGALSGAAGATLWEECLPIPAGVRVAATSLEADPVRWALYGGEDYELLLAVPPEGESHLQGCLAAAGLAPATRVGVLDAGPGIRLARHPGAEGRPLPVRGWDPLAPGPVVQDCGE